MTLELDRARIEQVVSALVERLDGDWLLIGGALVALWLEPRRVTEDIDVIGIAGTPAERLALFGLASDLGLPIEAVNSAADFFVHRIADWRVQIEVFRTGARGRLFRPTATLFLLLKLTRLSENDLADCCALLDHVATEPAIVIDGARILAALDGLPVASDAALSTRRAQLRSRIAAAKPQT